MIQPTLTLQSNIFAALLIQVKLFTYRANAKPSGTKISDKTFPISTIAATLDGCWLYASAKMYEKTPGGRLANNNTALICDASTGMKRSAAELMQ